MPQSRAEFYPATKISNPTRNFIPLLKFRIPRGILSRLCATRVFCSSILFCPALFYLVVLLHPAPFHLLASLRLAPAKTSKFFHSALKFLRFAASRPDRFVSCSRAYHRVLTYLDRAQSYCIRGGFLYKFCFF